MALINSASKSSRLLASRRYTHDTFTDAQESFTNVLDLQASEIYTQAKYIPSSGLPFSSSADHGSIHQASGSNLMKYWYRHKLTPSNVNTETWLFLNPTGSDDGVGAQLINDNQQTNFISPKYSVSSLANAITEDATPGYGVVVYKSSTYTQTSQTGSLGSSDKISGNDYIFDYKTGVLQFLNSSVDPASNEVVFMTAYQYIGKTLETGLDIAGDITASNMLLSGNLTLGGGDGDTIEVSAEYSGSIVPDVDNAFDLGSSAKQWKDIYINGTGYIDTFDTVTSTGVVSGSSVYGTTLGQNTTSGLKTITIESNSTVNQDLTTDANVQFAVITGSAVSSSGDVHGGSVTSTGTITGSAVYGTTIGQNRVDGVKTLTIESNSTVNQDLTTDANVQFNHITASGNISSSGTIYADNFQSTGGDSEGISFTDDLNITGHITASGTITGSEVYGTTIGQNRVDGVKTITIEANSIVNQDLTTDASPTFAGSTNGNIQVGVTGDNELDTNSGNLTIDSAGGTTTIDDILSVAGAATFDSTTTSTGNLSTAGVLSGSSDAFFGQYGVNYVSASNGSLQATNYISGSDIKGVSGDLGSLSVGNVTSTGTVSGSAVYGTTIGQNRTDGLKTITIEANSIINQDLSTDANATLGTLGVGNVTSTGTVSGSAVYGTTIGQNRSDGLKTITIEDTSTINQDVTTDATPTFAGINTTGNIVSQGDVIAENYIVSSSVTYMTQSFASGSNIFGDDILDTHQFTGSINQSGSFTLNSGDMAVTDTLTATNIGAYNLSGKLTAGSTEIEGSNFDINGGTIDGVSNVNSTGTITGSAVYGTTLGQNRVDGVKTITIESNSTINQDVTSDANVTFGTISSGNVTSTGTVSGSAVYGTTIGQNRSDGLKTITIEANSTVNQDLTTDADATLGTLAVGNVTSTGIVKSAGVLSGSSDAFFGQYGVSYISASNGSLQATNYISGSEVKSPTGTFGTVTISAGTITGITDITVADGGTGVSSLTDGGVLLGSGTDAITAMGVLSDGEMIVGDGTTDPVAESGATLRTSIGVGTGDSPQFTGVTATGTITGSAVYGTTIGQNRTDGLKTITIESNSTINQDVTTDATPTFDGITSTGTIASSGLISGSGDLWVGDQSNYISGSTGNVKVSGKISASSAGFTDVSASTAEFTSATITGGTISGITDLAVADGGTGASTLTDGGVLLGSGTSAVTAMAALGDGEFIVGDGSTDPVAESGATLRTSIGVGTGDSPTFTGLTLTGDLTVQGDTTTLSTTNLQVGDAFIFAATGSAASNVDGGLIVQSGSAVDSGSAIYHDTQDERWAVAKGVASDGTAVTPTSYVTTATTANHNPNTDSGSYGSGEMWINTTDEEIWVRTG